MVWVAAVTLVGLATALLVVPVRLRVDLDTTAGEGRPIVSARVRWLVLSWQSGVAGQRRAPRRPRRPGPRSRRRVEHGGRAMVALLGSPGVRASVFRFVRDVARPLVPRRASVRLRAGTGDPAEMGPWYPALSAVSTMPWPEAYRVRVEPDFTAQTLEVQACVEWSIRAAALAWPIVRFGVSPAVWRAGWSAVLASRAS